MSIKFFCTYLGIALSLVGVPLGMYFNYLFPVLEWSPLFMGVSVMLIMSYENLLLGRLPSFNKIFALIIAFQLLMLLYGFLSDNLTDQYLSFHLYIVSLIFALASNDRRMSYIEIIRVTFFVSLICTVLGAFFIWSGLVSGEEAWQLRQDNENYALEQFTVASGAITNLICAICYKSKFIITKIILIASLFLDGYIIFMSSKRTPIVVAIAILLIYFYKADFLKKGFNYIYVKYAIILGILSVLFYQFNNSFEKAIDDFTIYFYNGFLNILGDRTVTDGTGSAIARFQARNWAYNYIENQFGFFNYILGGGYMTRWIDNPLLQSYLDMGILGLLLYIYLVVILPIKSFFKVNNLFTLFALLLCVYNVMATYSSGHPYGYIKYVPIVFLAFAINLKPRKEKNANHNLTTTHTAL
jgi:hypothetical protein